jgi:hypothetical protein
MTDGDDPDSGHDPWWEAGQAYWGYRAGSYRKPGEVLPDMPEPVMEQKHPPKITPDLAVSLANGKNATKELAVMSDNEADYWHRKVEPKIQDAAKDGKFEARQWNLTKDMATRLKAYGKGLGWRVSVSSYDHEHYIEVKWGPWLNEIDRKALKVLGTGVLILTLILSVIAYFS